MGVIGSGREGRAEGKRRVTCNSNEEGEQMASFSEEDVPAVSLSYDETVDSMELDAEREFVAYGASPAVEASVRGIARDINQLREGERRSDRNYADDVKFSDGARNLSGRQALARYTPLRSCLNNPRAAVVRMQMRGEGTAVIWWRLFGSTAVGEVDAAVRTTVRLNLLTGRATSVVEEYDFTQSNPLASSLFQATRQLLATRELLQDTQQSISRTITDGDNRTDKQSEQGGIDPSSGALDPTRFTTGGNDNMNEYIQIAIVLSIAYIAFRVLLLID